MWFFGLIDIFQHITFVAVDCICSSAGEKLALDSAGMHYGSVCQCALCRCDYSDCHFSTNHSRSVCTVHLYEEKNFYWNALWLRVPVCSLQMCFFRLPFFNISHSICCSGLLEKKLTGNALWLCVPVCSLQMCFFRLPTVRKGLLRCINTNLFHRPQIHLLHHHHLLPPHHHHQADQKLPKESIKTAKK